MGNGIQVALTLCGFTMCEFHFVRGLDFFKKKSHCAIFLTFPHFVRSFYVIFLKNSLIELGIFLKEVYSNLEYLLDNIFVIFTRF